jgi:hypothetical protein
VSNLTSVSGNLPRKKEEQKAGTWLVYLLQAMEHHPLVTPAK